jgi:hypothetical protein
MVQRAVTNWFVVSPFLTTPEVQNSPGYRELSQTGLWRVLFLQHQEFRTVHGAEGDQNSP